MTGKITQTLNGIDKMRKEKTKKRDEKKKKEGEGEEKREERGVSQF